ncbi:hypothetical protein KC640_02785, partial [Candidatus Dojkabacteria bacterium]|nr:hypothetical protein [Candidatus Dojkabacteria bacterium]
SSETIYLNIGDESFTLTNAEIIVDLTTGQILVLSGKVTTPSAETATTGQVIDLSGSNTVSSLNRELLTSEPTIAYLLVALSEHQDLPTSLADTTAPELISLSPENGITSTDDKAFISGKTEAGATVLINSSPATVDENGDFGLEVPLQMGENNLEILVTDPAGNTYHTQLTITRQAPVATSSCSRPAIADQIISAINSYRAASGLGQLVPTASLNNAAQGHSCWMQSARTLNHIGSGGSTFNGRCAAAGGACDAENIAWAVGFSAQGIVDLWKASAGHNQNMLGSHTQIGVGYAGGYATAVFY